MIAALYVQTGGAYFSQEGVEGRHAAGQGHRRIVLADELTSHDLFSTQ